MNGVDIVGDVSEVGGMCRLGVTLHVGRTVHGQSRQSPWEDMHRDTVRIFESGLEMASSPVQLRAREAIGDFVVNLAPLPRGNPRELPDVQG